MQSSDSASLSKLVHQLKFAKVDSNTSIVALALIVLTRSYGRYCPSTFVAYVRYSAITAHT